MQMLLVAFSRRMCCSRVCSASRYAGCAVGVDGDADEAAGQLPLQPVADRHVAGVRAAEAVAGRRSAARSPRRCRRRTPPAARAASAPAGRRRRRPARRARAPARSAAQVADRAATRPGTAAARRRSRRRAGPPDRSATTTSMPSGTARVRTTSIVCGSASASTRNAPRLLRLAARWARVIASAAAVPSSSSEAFGDRQPGQVADHGLEVQQRLEAALGDLRLVRACRRCTSRGSPGRCAGSRPG